MATQVLNPHLARQCVVISLLEGVLNKPIHVAVPDTSKPLRFPKQLIQAIGGESVLNEAPTIIVEEQGTGYFDGCLSMAMVPEGKVAIKGCDQYGRVFFSFLMHNDNFEQIKRDDGITLKRCVLFTVFQCYHDGSARDIDQVQFNHRWCECAPTTDMNFIHSCSMSDEKYASIAKVFAGTHPDLKLGRN